MRFLTAGESHGRKEMAILEGFPAGVNLDMDFINDQLAQRQQGYGRGERMNIEQDTIDEITGVRDGITIGSPIGIVIHNKDTSIDNLPSVKAPRPGHADLAGLQKYDFKEARSVLERASARETVCRVAVGAICKLFLMEFDINIISHVVAIGKVRISKEDLSLAEIKQRISNSKLRCIDKKAESKMIKEIDKAKQEKDTLGGVVEIIMEGVPPGLGSYVHYDRKLDSRLSQAVTSIPGVKAVEIGEGIGNARKKGSEVHDEIFYDKGFCRDTNRAGGLEGGVSNGERIKLRIFMKPISTLMQPLKTVEVDSKKETEAVKERADVCAVPSCGVISESMGAFILADEFLRKFGSDTLKDIKGSYYSFIDRINE